MPYNLTGTQLFLVWGDRNYGQQKSPAHLSSSFRRLVRSVEGHLDAV